MSNDAIKTILLVDDDEDFLLQQELVLTQADFDVTTASSEAQADEILKTMRPDLVILDLMLEHVDGGFSLCFKIKQKDPTIPIIILSSVASETGLEFDAATTEERSWIKADAFLSKPTRFEQLRREIDRLLEAVNK